MKPDAAPIVAVHELRVGMYVHLDLGWMDHPFPLSSFRIASAEQIATIRGLGLQRLRWVPEKSVLEMPPPAPPPLPTPAAAAADDATRRQREQLAAQRAALKVCERQYAEAGRAWREAHDAVFADPAGARTRTEALTGALLDKMLVDGDVCIRLVAGGNGDRSGAHALNVAVVALLMGRTFGMSRDELMELGVGALLHDVGKLELSERLRHADEGFSSAEISGWREHVARGVAHGRRMQLSAGALLVLAQHHEHADGSGFPQKLGVDRMSTAARIVALVNRYDNLCNPAQPGRALTPHEALSQLFAQSRARYDATILNAFIRMMGVYPAGSVVQLTDDRYAIVSAVNSSRPLKPSVLVHERGGGTRCVDLERTPDLGIRRSLNPARLPADALDALAPRPRVAYYFDATAAAAAQPAEACA